MEPPPKQYFNSTKLDEIILNYPIRPRDISAKDRETEVANRRCFLDFIKGLLSLNPIERWSPIQAAQHPFITGRPFTEPFVPQLTSAPIPMAPSRSRQTTGAAIAGGKARPRANTLSSLSLQDIPPQIQRVGAANKDKNAPGVGPIERSDVIPEASTEMENAPPPLPFEETGISPGNAAFSVSSHSSSSHLTSPPSLITASHAASLQQQHHPHHQSNNAHANLGKTSMHPHSERLNAYASNRRVSQPAVPVLAGRYGPRASNIALSQAYASGGTAQGVIPSSLPNSMWYGPEAPFSMSFTNNNNGNGSNTNAVTMDINNMDKSTNKTKSSSNYYQRRGSLRSEPFDGGAGSSNNPGWRSPGGRRASVPGAPGSIPNDARPRRTSLSSLSSNAMPEDGEEYSSEEGMPRSAASMMDALDETEEDPK